MPSNQHSERISPTAHYTGQIWQMHGLSTPVLATLEGPLFYQVLRPANALSKRLGGPTLTGMLLARHRSIDQLLTRAIDEGRVGQVLEIAAGYSPRGWRFTKKYGARIRYVEADLPHMAEQKRALLAKIDPAERPEVIAFDALKDAGPLSLEAAIRDFDPGRGLAVITEGLCGYLELDDAKGMWSRIQQAFRHFPHGVYLSDMRTSDRAKDSIAAKVFLRLLSTFVRGRVHLHFADDAEAARAFTALGFGGATLHRPVDLEKSVASGLDKGREFVQILEATLSRP